MLGFTNTIANPKKNYKHPNTMNSLWRDKNSKLSKKNSLVPIAPNQFHKQEYLKYISLTNSKNLCK